MNRRSVLLFAAVAALALTAAGPAAGQTRPCVVAFVVDGDTFNCRDGTTVRLLGADAPEGGRFGNASRRALLTLAPVDSTVRLEVEGEKDSQGRTLAYVFAGEKMVNEVLVKLGYAFYRPDPDRTRYAPRLRAAEREAKQGRLGVWSL